MQDIKTVTVHYPYYKNISGGQEWPNRWDKLLGLHMLPSVWGWYP